MPPPQSKNRVGLGHAILNRRAKEAREQHTSEFHTTDTKLGKPKADRLKSVTHEGALEEFLNTAQLADADFTAERRNVRVIQAPNTSRTRHNPYLLTPQQEADVQKNQRENRERLRVPRRPAWDERTTPAQLERAEKDSFLDWRRGLAELQDGIGLVLTPFERNLEVWRQLWRVIERSQLLVQIVDARNPLLFRCEDLERYVISLPANVAEQSSIPPEEAGSYRGPRRTLLLVNKADLLDDEQRRQWARYFESIGLPFAFFSATDASARQAAKAQREAQFEAAASGDAAASAAEATSAEALLDVARTTLDDDPARILNVLQLEQLFLDAAPPLEPFARNGEVPQKLTVGLVGYPNVGKSSTINALLGEKKVSVSATPGKTKHFQTIHLSPTTVLCDCPGLVFPQFASTAAELVTDGILPIDQMREYTAPAELVARRIPGDILERLYNMPIPTLSREEGGNGQPTGIELLTAYAIARGLARQGQGNPDESRAARYVLKDYVNARLLYAHPPPGVDPDEFNAAPREHLRATLPERRAGPPPPMQAAQRGKGGTVANASSGSDGGGADSFDTEFFGSSGANGPVFLGRRRVPQVGQGSASKKHYKGNKRAGRQRGVGL